MPTFATNFLPPPPPANLEIVGEVAPSRILLTWDATALGTDFAGYRVYRSLDAGATWTLMLTIGDETAATYSDYEAPLATPLLYQVTVTNLDFESAPTEAGVQLDTEVGWYLVDPLGNTERTFALAYVVSATSTSPLDEDRFAALGRSRVLPIRGEVLGEDLSVTIDAGPDVADDLWRRLKLAQDPSTDYLLLKSPFGEVFRVALGSISRNRGDAGQQSITVPVVEVA